MYPSVVLVTPTGFLRPMCGADVTEKYVSGLNNPQVNRFLEVRHSVQNYRSVITFVDENKYSENMILWGLWHGLSTSVCLVGTVRLHGINTSCCHIGICLFETESWGKGLGTQAIRAVTAWAFDSLNLDTLKAGVHIENIGSQQAFVRAGYRLSNKNNPYSNIYLASKKDFYKPRQK